MSSNVYKPFYKKWKHLSRPIFGEHEEKIRKFKKQKWKMLQQHDLKPSILKKKQSLTSSRFIFGNGLKQKKALKLFYGLKERQVKKIVRNTNPYNSRSGRPLGGLLERQLGTVLYRLNFVPSMAKGRQLIGHKKIKVNGKTVWAKNYPLSYLDLLELELGPTRELVNTIKNGPSIQRLKKSSPYSQTNGGPALLATKAEYALNTYKDRLSSSFDGLDLKLNKDGDSLVPSSVCKVTNIAPVENATVLSLLDFHNQEEDKDESGQSSESSDDSSSKYETGVQNESLFDELIEGTNDLKNHTLLDSRHPGLNAIGKFPKNGQLYSKHIFHRWEERLNEQILIHIGNENFSKDSDGMLEFCTRHAVIDSLNMAKEYEIKFMQEYVKRSRQSNFADLALTQESNKTVYKPSRIRRKDKYHDVGDAKDLLRNDYLTHHKALRRMKYKPFLSLRKPSLQQKKRMELLKLLLKNKKHPNMQIDYKNLIAVYVKELQTDEVKYPFQFSYKEFLEFYNI